MWTTLKWTPRIAAAAGVLVLWGVAAAEAQTPQLDIGADLRVIEGDSGTTSYTIQVTPTGPSILGHSVSWRTLAGSAQGGTDFLVVSSGPLSWGPGDPSPKPLTVQVVGDINPEWSSTLQQDEVFFVELFNCVNCTIRRGRATVTIVDNDSVQPGAQLLSAVTDSTSSASTDGRNRLQWRVPAATTAPTAFKVCWKSTSTPPCASPLSDTDTAGGGCSVINGPFTAGSKMSFTHDNTITPKVQLNMAYCYSVFTMYPAFSAERAEVSMRTFDSTPGPVRWAFSAGHYGGAAVVNVAPPTVGFDGVFSIGTDGVVQALQRGYLTGTGGLWPATWNPLALGKPGHNRAPVVTMPAPAGARFFVGTESGEVHAVDAKVGTIVWSRAAGFPAGSDPLMTGANPSTGVQAVPAGLFKSFGGLNDMLLVGTATSIGNTKFFALDPATGATLDFYPNTGDTPPGAIDNVYGMATVDYAANRVYFGAQLIGSPYTFWSLDLGPSGTPDLKLTLLPWNPKPLGITGGTTGSPVLRNGQIYLGTDSGVAAQIHSLRLSDGTLYSFMHGDGQLKGFAWPDRRNGQLYFSTVNKVFGVNDNGTTLTQLWSPISVQGASIPLQIPGTNYLYVGNNQGQLVEIDVSSGTIINSIPLDTGTVQIGAPSLDNVNGLVYVGSEKGVIYAVQVPF